MRESKETMVKKSASTNLRRFRHSENRTPVSNASCMIALGYVTVQWGARTTQTRLSARILTSMRAFKIFRRNVVVGAGEHNNKKQLLL